MTGFEELGGSPKESFTESSGPTVDRKFLVPMNTRLAFVETLVGSTYPHFPDARVVQIDLQPWHEDLPSSGAIVSPALTSADYADQPCLVTVKYGPDYRAKTWPSDIPKPTIQSGTELRLQIRGGAQFLTVPASSMAWLAADAPVPEDVNAAILISIGQYQLQWDFVNNPPIEAIEEATGKVNVSPFLGAPAETLLLESYDVSESFVMSALTPHTNRVTLHFARRRIQDGENTRGWNHDYRETDDGGVWDKLQLNGEDRYQATNFANILNPS